MDEFDDYDVDWQPSTISTPNLVEQRDRQSARFTPEARILERTNRIVQGSMKVQVENTTGGAIACTDSKQRILIDFNGVLRASSDAVDFMATLKGVNYHELAHIRFSLIDYVADVVNNQYNIPGVGFSIKDAINYLIDQRDETLFAASFPRSIDYFTRSVMKLVLAGSVASNPFGAHCLITGRRYLPLRFRRQVADAARRTPFGSRVDRVTELVEQFVRSVDVKEMLGIAVEFAGLLPANFKPPINELYEDGSSTKPRVREGESAVGEFGESFGDAEADAGEAGDESDAGEAGEADGHGRVGDAEVEAGEAGGGSGSSRDESRGVAEAAEELLAESTERVFEESSSEAAEAEAERREGDLFDHGGFTVTGEHELARDAIKKVLRNARIDLRNSYLREQSSGRLDVRRVLNTKGLSSKVFRKYRENRLGRGKIAAAILLDASGSMHFPQWTAVRDAAWVVANALVESGDAVQVHQFSSGSDQMVMLPFGRSACNWERMFNGGTEASPSLRVARDDLQRMKNKGFEQRFMFIFTDGVFDDPTHSRRVIEAMNKDGVVTVLIEPWTEYGEKNKREYGESEHYLVKEYGDVKDVMLKVMRNRELVLARR